MNTIDFKSLSEIQKKLVLKAIEIRGMAYSPYSGYKVGSALLDKNGNIHTGCNVESADFTLSSHAEMVAIDSMVKSGVLELTDIAVAVKSKEEYAMPCGLCRQKIREFVKSGKIKIIGINLNSKNEINNIYISTLEELLPYSFCADYLHN